MSLQPTFGKLYSFVPTKPAFMAAMATFEVGSILCASAPTSNIFILGRVISGIGAAGIYAGGMVIITSAVPLKRIPIFLATLSSMWALSAIIGPILGGAFSDSRKLTWRFCFWINLRKNPMLRIRTRSDAPSIRRSSNSILCCGILTTEEGTLRCSAQGKDCGHGPSRDNPVRYKHRTPLRRTRVWRYSVCMEQLSRNSLLYLLRAMYGGVRHSSMVSRREVRSHICRKRVSLTLI